jgi:hypothetical protein
MNDVDRVVRVYLGLVKAICVHNSKHAICDEEQAAEVYGKARAQLPEQLELALKEVMPLLIKASFFMLKWKYIESSKKLQEMQQLIRQLPDHAAPYYS